MILVNGSEGIGTGWSTFIIHKLENPVPMHPWYRGFRGCIEQTSKDKYKVCGAIESGYKENHTMANVDFKVQLTEEKLNNALEEGLEKMFKLGIGIATSNVICFDWKGRIKKYNPTEEILLEFCDYRLKYYYKRKDHMLRVLELKVNQLAKFIQMNIDHNLVFEGLHKAEIIKILESEFERFRNAKEIRKRKEEAQKRMNKKAEKEMEFIVLRKKTPREILKEDLDAFLDEWNELLNSDQTIY
ncbi:hypothetical protein RclHR1_02240001 [Rhizophagus clarus]|uniref:DNA topoisomerase (ATP-hydrolyzing) n=1 Tax=Rhizophagus clarus TaxID=94130 RepID=A0A2Z6R7Q7_9GLOM|nr:hypothetical protein RclHR1_02240001 [Rhizophagus clarus]